MNNLVERKITINMLAYCDYIAKVISEAMKKDADKYSSYIDNVGKTRWDLDASTGAFLSTRKTISVIDKNGKAYRVTIEEVK
jgi:GH18 family chitinase